MAQIHEFHLNAYSIIKLVILLIKVLKNIEIKYFYISLICLSTNFFLKNRIKIFLIIFCYYFYIKNILNFAII